MTFENVSFNPGVEYKKVTVGTLPMEAELVSTDDLRYIPKQLGLFASRHDAESSTKIQDVDRQIADQFQTQFTALMFHLDLETEAETFGALQLIVLKSICLSILRPIMEKHNAIELEPELFIFHEASDAVLASLDSKDALNHYNTSLTKEHNKDTITVHGWGVHHGVMIFVDGTDIHWGDPVNTSSKLGQDLAKDGDLLISKSVEELVRDHSLLSSESGITFESRVLKRSGVDFEAFCVTRSKKSTLE